jgi:hypothetical protein
VVKVEEGHARDPRLRARPRRPPGPRHKRR